MAKELQDLIKRVDAAVKSDQVMRIALTTVLPQHKQRIFQNGQDADGSKIGTYSKKPISISKKNQARDTGKTYFPGGYDEYKSSIGKGGTVNWRNTDQMSMDYGIIENGGQFGYGFQNAENYNKSQWLQEKYDKDVIDLSQKELNTLGDVLQHEVEKRI